MILRGNGCPDHYRGDPGFFMKIVLAALLSVLLWSPPLKADPEADFAWWRLSNISYASDGAAQVLLELLAPPQLGPEAEALIYVREQPWQRPRRNRLFGEPEYRCLRLKGPFPQKLEIRSQRNEKVDLYAELRDGEQKYYARTVFHLYYSQKNDGGSLLPGPQLEQLPPWPGLNYLPDGYSGFRAQTGEDLNFAAENLAAPFPSLSVMERGSLVQTVAADSQGRYVYTPPHDPQLSRFGYMNHKDLLLLGRLPEAKTSFTFYIPLYRSYYGHISLSKGLGLLALTMALTAAAARFWRRRYP